MNLTSCLKQKSEFGNADTLIVSFAGYNKLFGGIPRFEFANFLNAHFANTDRQFYVDCRMDLYHRGIAGISKTVDETVEYLKTEIDGYKRVVFIGVSAGGYAAILFGSLLNIASVVAFIPQTLRMRQNIDEKYRDTGLYINATTQYYLYGDLSIIDIKDYHHISQCERIAHHDNVTLIKKEVFNIKKMRDDGELLNILQKVLQPNIVK